MWILLSNSRKLTNSFCRHLFESICLWSWDDFKCVKVLNKQFYWFCLMNERVFVPEPETIWGWHWVFRKDLRDLINLELCLVFLVGLSSFLIGKFYTCFEFIYLSRLHLSPINRFLRSKMLDIAALNPKPTTSDSQTPTISADAKNQLIDATKSKLFKT